MHKKTKTGEMRLLNNARIKDKSLNPYLTESLPKQKILYIMWLLNKAKKPQ